MSTAWVTDSTEEFARSFRRSRKRHEASCDAALTRLQHFHDWWLNNPQLAPGFHLPGDGFTLKGRVSWRWTKARKAIWQPSGSIYTLIIPPGVSGSCG